VHWLDLELPIVNGCHFITVYTYMCTRKHDTYFLVVTTNGVSLKWTLGWLASFPGLLFFCLQYEKRGEGLKEFIVGCLPLTYPRRWRYSFLLLTRQEDCMHRVAFSAVDVWMNRALAIMATWILGDTRLSLA